MLKSILKALAIILLPTVLLIITSIVLYYIVSRLQCSLTGNMLSFIIIMLTVILYSIALGKIGNLIDRL